MQSRHLSRQVALQALASLFLEAGDAHERFSFVHKEFAPRLVNPEFSQSIFEGVLKNQKAIDEHLARFAPEWPIEKLDAVERAVLEIGTFEILFFKTPVAVAINESVELAKEFGDESSPKFINGVLNALAHDESPKT